MNTNNHNGLEEKGTNFRYRLSVLIILVATLGIGSVAYLAMCCGSDLSGDTVFTAVIGLAGTWVGTILAFYFSKDNFEAAEKSTRAMVDKFRTSTQKLASTLASSVMLKISQAAVLVLKDEDQSIILLTNILEKMGDHYRLPVLDTSGRLLYIIHRSMIDRFLAQSFLTQNNDNQPYTLNTLLSDRTAGDAISKGIVTVKPTDTLHLAKLKMELKREDGVMCSDIFVTDDGTRNGKVLGWITNNDLNKHSHVEG
ncbi:MAG: CBS domain-containing protein [Flavobacteriales bacterium]|nr:CBS domain-containing protein [Flavobacteriales bacterium]